MKKNIQKREAEAENIKLLDYVSTLAEIKKHIEEAQVRATFAVNKELLWLYWNIGKLIVEKQQTHGWGAQIIEKLASDIQNTFPGLKGFSRSNIFYMKAFYEFVQKGSGQLEDLPFFHIPWWHNITLLTKLKDDRERLWYAQKAIEHGWSGNILIMQIESKSYSRTGKVISNFKATLPASHSDMAQQSFKDPYIFDFLTLHEKHLERDLEEGLMAHVEKLLLEMGKGFSLVGRHYHLSVGERDFYIDLLFYHYKLRCFVVVELKADEFVPEFAGKLNFYLSAVDDLVKGPEDRPTIGLLLCKTKDNFIAEYALRNVSSPIGVAEYKTEIMKKLPKELKSSLPTIEEIEEGLEKAEALQKQEK